MKLFIILLLTFFTLPHLSGVQAAMTYGNGYYTNLCGTGTAATADTCNKGCNPATGSCTSDKPYVIKWTCNGNVKECRMKESGFALSQNIGNTECGQTVLIQVYNRNCRTYFGWICNAANLQDSMLWYSGDCQGNSQGTPMPASPTPVQSGNQTAGFCEEFTTTAGNGSTVPATVKFHVKTPASVNPAAYRYFFGDGTKSESSSADSEHTYDISGTFIARSEVQDQNGTWSSSPRCETVATVKPSTLETHKSGCSDVFVVDGNNTQAPTTMSIRVTGYDNKGAIKKYLLRGPDSAVLENSSGAFQMRFESAGTYTVRGSIVDSTGAEKSGSDTASCETTVQVRTDSITRQPDTGTPTLLSVLAIVSGVMGVTLLKLFPAKRHTHVRSTSKKTSTTRRRHHT